jgi:hypothetical protein
MPPHLVMQAREKHSVQHIVEAAFGARIGAIEGKCPLLPAKPDHGTPFLHHGVFFGHEHWNFLHSHDGHTTASINATAGLPPKPANALSEVTFKDLVTSDQTQPFSRNRSPALKRSNKRPEKFAKRAYGNANGLRRASGLEGSHFQFTLSPRS